MTAEELESLYKSVDEQRKRDIRRYAVTSRDDDRSVNPWQTVTLTCAFWFAFAVASGFLCTLIHNRCLTFGNVLCQIMLLPGVFAITDVVCSVICHLALSVPTRLVPFHVGYFFLIFAPCSQIGSKADANAADGKRASHAQNSSASAAVSRPTSDEDRKLGKGDRKLVDDLSSAQQQQPLTLNQ